MVSSRGEEGKGKLKGDSLNLAAFPKEITSILWLGCLSPRADNFNALRKESKTRVKKAKQFDKGNSYCECKEPQAPCHITVG